MGEPKVVYNIVLHPESEPPCLSGASTSLYFARHNTFELESSIQVERFPSTFEFASFLFPKNKLGFCSFQGEIAVIKTCFEQNLKLNTTLALNDVLSVWYHGTKHDVKVIDIKPENACRIIDTDIEVDFDVSVEYKEHLLKVEEEAKALRLAQEKAEALRLVEVEALRLAEAELKAKAKVEAEKRKLKNIGNTNIDTTVSKSKTTSFQNIKNNLAEIREEPTKLNEEEIANNIKIITLKFRLPERVIIRKFKTSDTINSLFGFIVKEHLSNSDINCIRIVNVVSNQTIKLEDHYNLTLNNLGIVVNQVLSVMIDE
jgi:hypothetical protein